MSDRHGSGGRPLSPWSLDLGRARSNRFFTPLVRRYIGEVPKGRSDRDNSSQRRLASWILAIMATTASSACSLVRLCLAAGGTGHPSSGNRDRMPSLSGWSPCLLSRITASLLPSIKLMVSPVAMPPSAKKVSPATTWRFQVGAWYSWRSSELCRLGSPPLDVPRSDLARIAISDTVNSDTMQSLHGGTR